MTGILITVIGRDKPGILARISSVIAEIGGNIDDIKGHVIEIKNGGRIANLSLYVVGPNEASFYQKIREELDKIAKELDLKIYIDPVINFMK